MVRENKNASPTSFESATTMGLSVVTGAVLLQSLDSYNYIDAGWIQQLPAADHLSSIAGSYAFGAVGGALTERFASHFASKGREDAAEGVRLIGNTVTMLGSLAYQLTIESSTRGVSDKWDIVAGIVATAPGIIAGKGYARIRKRIKQPLGS